MIRRHVGVVSMRMTETRGLSLALQVLRHNRPPPASASATTAIAEAFPLLFSSHPSARSTTFPLQCTTNTNLGSRTATSPQHRHYSSTGIRSWFADGKTTKSKSRPSPNDNRRSNKPNKKFKIKQVSGDAGRVVLQGSSSGAVSKKGNTKLCSGCGAEVTGKGRAASTSYNHNDDAAADVSKTYVTGQDAVASKANSSRTKQAKKSRYFDPFDKQQASSSFLCDRCKALQQGNLWQAYDALEDVSPQVFRDQLQHIVTRRRFGLALMVVDGSDAEHSVVKNLRKVIGSVPVWLVLNKTDLLPRMTPRDVRNLTAQIQKMSGLKFMDVVAVSALEDRGILDLAEALLADLRGRDVFVLGAANVGKSTLVQRLSSTIAYGVYMKGIKGAKRRDLVQDLNVTASHLPGTTLQSVRIPCFSSPGHALWDTPGIINPRAVQYSIFPSHLMEPLTRPGTFPIPTRDNGHDFYLRKGYSILVEAPWMMADDDNDHGHYTENVNYEKGATAEQNYPGVLARVDLVGLDDWQMRVQAFLHPSLKVRIVPTAQAPNRAIIPASHVQRINQRMKVSTHFVDSKDNHYSKNLLPFCPPNNPSGEVVPGENEYSPSSELLAMDIVFPSLGWLAFIHKQEYRLIPHCVEGSVFSKRRSLYPVNLRTNIKTYGDGHLEPDVLDDSAKYRLQDAARSGRHNERRGKNSDGDKGEGDLDFYEDDDDFYY